MSGWFSHFMKHPATYLKWGWIQISVTNLVVILLMFAIFLAAVFIPFPTHNESHDEIKNKGDKK